MSGVHSYEAPLSALCLQNLRNLSQSRLSLGQINYFYGDNGAGKTSLLEAFYLLGHLRSFRPTRKVDSIVTHGAPFLLVEGKGRRSFKVQKMLHQPWQLRVDGAACSASQFIHATPAVIAVSPHLGGLVDGSAEVRRMLFNVLMTHTEPAFYDLLQFYEHTLESRNAVLKSGRLADDDFWMGMLVRHGKPIADLQAKVFEKWQPLFEYYYHEGGTDTPVACSFQKGYEGDSFLDSLVKARQGDTGVGYTRHGPHRFDLQFSAGKTKASHFLSRGQMKRAHLASVMASLSLLSACKPTLLILDDFSSEFDLNNMMWMVEQLRALPIQVVISGIEEPGQLFDWRKEGNSMVFLVKNGEVHAV